LGVDILGSCRGSSPHGVGVGTGQAGEQ
jgi:hypothetical protein